MEKASDAKLISATKAGDTAAFGLLIQRHQQAALRVAAVTLGSADGADDVAQEAFVKLFNSIHRFLDGERLEPWLFKIVANTARNRLRTEGRQRSLQVRALAHVGVDHPDPDETAVHLADRRALIGAINRLRLEDRLVLTYRWYEDMSESEIATAMDCRPGTVKSRLSRAMDRLRMEMGEK